MIDDEPGEMRCRCGAASCRGTITGSDWRKAEFQKKYDGYFSWFIQRRIDALKRGQNQTAGELFGLVRGANPEGYRDRSGRF